ncbi:MAG: M14 family zinc carboxypeptidase [Melioribacteraceae bacterium]
MDTITLINQLYEKYSIYCESKFTNKFIKHSHVKELIAKLQSTTNFEISKIGESIQEREIYCIKIGKGKTKILLWSQMHGDEPTATMSLFDLLIFFKAKDGYDLFRKELLENLTLYIVPMLNPDGAEVFTRENAINIDLNRDYIKEVSPEAKILKRIQDEIQPQFGFNLHDQDSYYSPGNSYKSTAMSFLAPPPDYSNKITPVRDESIRVISGIINILQNFIPGHIARYKDDHEPRSFGDNFILKGTSSILIESGYWDSDEDKFFIRKLNFIAILSALRIISTGEYKLFEDKTYFSTPVNVESFFDLLIKDVFIINNNSKFLVDIGIIRKKVYDTKNNCYNIKSYIKEVGDLSYSNAHEVFSRDSLRLIEGNLSINSDAKFKLLDSDDIIYCFNNGLLKI